MRDSYDSVTIRHGIVDWNACLRCDDELQEDRNGDKHCPWCDDPTTAAEADDD